MLTGKNVGAQMSAGDSVVSGELKGGPPDRVEQRSALQPIRDGLLADSGPRTRRRVIRKKLPKLARKGILATADIDCPLQGDNVVFLHGTAQYTRKLVTVNKEPCLTSDKDSCMLLDMPTTKRKAAPVLPKPTKRRRTPDPEVGPDGRTFAQRVILLMEERGIGQTQLARLCSEYYATFNPGVEDKVKQQHIFNVMQGQSSTQALPLMAAVFDVNEMWLQYGIGKRERTLKN